MPNKLHHKAIPNSKLKTIYTLFYITYHNLSNGYIFTNPKPTFLTNSITFPTTTNKNQLTMKLSSGKGKAKTAKYKGSTIAMTNYQRLRAAGKKGTKKFLDPCKLFIGNLSYNTTESDLEEFFVDYLPKEHIMSIKIIREWKTQESKGYGFIVFREPIYATSALETIKGKRLDGRIVRLNQGQKKLDDSIFLIKKKKKEEQEEEFDFSFIENNDDDEDEFEGYEGDEDLMNGKYQDEYLLDDDLNIVKSTREERTATSRKERRELKVKARKMLKKRAVGFGGASSGEIKEM